MYSVQCTNAASANGGKVPFTLTNEFGHNMKICNAGPKCPCNCDCRALFSLNKYNSIVNHQLYCKELEKKKAKDSSSSSTSLSNWVPQTDDDTPAFQESLQLALKRSLEDNHNFVDMTNDQQASTSGFDLIKHNKTGLTVTGQHELRNALGVPTSKLVGGARIQSLDSHIRSNSNQRHYQNVLLNQYTTPTTSSNSSSSSSSAAVVTALTSSNNNNEPTNIVEDCTKVLKTKIRKKIYQNTATENKEFLRSKLSELEKDAMESSIKEFVIDNEIVEASSQNMDLFYEIYIGF